jgi:uncharacterized protein
VRADWSGLGEPQVYSYGVTDDPIMTPEALPTDAELLPYSPPEAVRWGLWEVILCIGVFIGIQVISVVVILLSRLSAEDTFALGLFSFVLGLVTYGAFLAILIHASKRKGLGTFAADFGLRFKPVDIPIAIGAFLAAKIAAILFGILAIVVTGDTSNRSNLVLSSDSVWIVLNAVVIATLVAPIVEELVFRGLVLRSVRNFVLRRGARRHEVTDATRRNAVIWAILVSSLAFAALHLAQAATPAMFIVLAGSTFAVGVINAATALSTGRLGAPILTHVLYNGSSVAIALAIAAGPS